MKLAIEIFFSVCFTIGGYIAVCSYFSGTHGKKPFWQGMPPKTKSRLLYLSAEAAAFSVLIALLWVYYREDSLLHQLKLLTLTGFLFPIAAVDYRVKKIPNKFLAGALVSWIILWFITVMTDFGAALTLASEGLIGAVVIGLFCFLARLVSRGGIGMGDIKLFAMLGLYQGLWGAVNSLFFSLSLSFVLALGLLASHKKGLRDEIPFAPGILLGTLIAMGLSGF